MNANSQIGRKVILWDEKYRQGGYIDQFGFSHPAYLVTREFLVTIVEEKEVPNVWGSGTSTGWKAIAEDGRIFTCNWNRFPDDSMTPTYYWDTIDENGYLWQPVDAIQASALFPHVDKDGNKKIPANAIVCQKHNEMHLDNEKCWRCELEKMRLKHNMV